MELVKKDYTRLAKSDNTELRKSKTGLGKTNNTIPWEKDNIKLAKLGKNKYMELVKCDYMWPVKSNDMESAELTISNDMK